MKQPRRLSLKREALVELTTTDLQAVQAGQGITPLLTQILDPSSNTWPCSDGC